jgi:hypothetical protein
VVKFIFVDDVVITPLIIIKKTMIQICWFVNIRNNNIIINVFNSGYFNDFFLMITTLESIK